MKHVSRVDCFDNCKIHEVYTKPKKVVSKYTWTPDSPRADGTDGFTFTLIISIGGHDADVPGGYLGPLCRPPQVLHPAGPRGQLLPSGGKIIKKGFPEN